MRKTLLTLLVGLSLTTLLSAMVWPDDFFSKLKENLATYQDMIPTERIYVQSDKMHYLAGETVWLSGYVRALNDFSKAGKSEILHVELTSAAGKTLDIRGFVVKEGVAEGTLELSQDLPSGNYQIRAYTLWQNNEKDPAIFHKQIFVKGRKEMKPSAPSEASSPYQFDLFPEGGYMVEGLTSRVAFKMTNEKGEPMEVAGTVKDDRGKLIATFSDVVSGMGAFDLQPERGRSYQVDISKPKGLKKSIGLPTALRQGVVLHLDEITDESAFFTVQSSVSQPISMVLRQREKIMYQAKKDLPAGTDKLKIPFRDMQMGLAQLTIFDQEERPIAERLMYLQGAGSLKIEVQTDKDQYGPREDVKLSLTVTDEEGRPCAADLSLAAIEETFAEASAGKGSNILTWMTLESELKGKVYDPQSFFDSHNLVKTQAVDYLLMTQGWRRYDWQDLALSPQAPAFRAEQLALTGTVVNTYNQQPIAHAQVMLNDGEKVVSTNENGHFIMPRPQPERAISLHISAPGFRTQTQRIIGMPGELKYELQVLPVVTPQTADRLSNSPTSGAKWVEQAEPLNYIEKPTSTVSLPYFWPEKIYKPLAPVVQKPEEQSFDTETATLTMGEVDIKAFGRVPVFYRDPNMQSVTQFEGKEIEHLGVRELNDVVALSASVYQADAEDPAISIRGALPSSTMYIVDGVKVRGGAELPKMAMDKVQVYLSGSPAEYGDFTGGVVVMESKGPRMMWLMDTVAIIETPPQPKNLEPLLSKLQPIQGEIQGKCEVTVFVDEEGNYKRHKVLYTTDREWAKQIKPFLDQLQFEPAITTEGTPYPYHVDLPFAFFADDELAKDHPTDTLYLPELRGKADFYAARSFYIPPVSAFKGKKDDRTTLYWDGHVKVPASGRATIRFRTSDVATRFGVVVEGIGRNGRVGFCE